MATMKSKPVAFNVDNAQEKALFDFCERIPKGKFGAYIKSLIQSDITRRNAQRKPPNGGSEV